MVINHSDNIVLMWLSRQPELQEKGWVVHVVHEWVGGMRLEGFFGSVQTCGESIFMSSGFCVCVYVYEAGCVCGTKGMKPLVTCFFL